jgi:hypothetical protein
MLSVVDDARALAWEGHAAWSESFNEMFAQAAGCFGNAAVRRRGRAYLLGLLSHAERKNSWSLAEFAGDASPDGMQRLLNFSPWDQDACRDAVHRYVVANLGDPGAVLIVDETGFLKKGTMSAGVARMYTGTAGRVENCQVGVFLAYAAPDGSRALTDRELYLPAKWTDDRERCRAAGTGDDVAFATKPQLAWQMIERAVAAGVPFAWVAGDEVYGQNPGLPVSLFRRPKTCRKSGQSRCTRDVLRRPSQRTARCQESTTKVTSPGSGQGVLDVPSPVTSLPEWGSRRPPAVKTSHVAARFHTCVAGRAVQVIDTENSWYWTVQSAGTLAA